MENKLTFISYRREDEGASARILKNLLDDYFGSEQIFMDVDNIRIGNKWTDTIEKHLLKASVLIVIIGKNWLCLHDKFFRRRIDIEDDWVRKEIEISIKRGIKIITVYFGVSVLEQESLPLSIKTLTNYQALTLSAVNNDESLGQLCSELEQIGFQKKTQSEKYPVIRPEDKIGSNFPLALSENEIQNELKKIPEWEVVKYKNKNTNALERTYEFRKFENAIEFMAIVSKYISKVQHHPEWENIWKTLRVRLTTWDIGHKVSYLDFKIAGYLDDEFKKYKSKL